MLEPVFRKAREAGNSLVDLSSDKINEILLSLADNTEAAVDDILAANRLDLDAMDPESPKYDRLQLTAGRIAAIAADMRNVAGLPSPVGRVIEARTLPNGLRLRKVRVPFGVIGIIYEARPNVSFDVFSLCFKSGNACILKGGHEAEHSNRAIVDVISRTLRHHGVSTDAVTLLPNDREATSELLHARDYVDLIIPRGGRSLIDFVRNNSVVPVIETGAGVCHTYFDSEADLAKGTAIVNNAKTRRVSVCNALDCLLVASDRLSDLPALCAPLASRDVMIYADERAYKSLESHYPSSLLFHAAPDDFGREFLDYKMAVKTVAGVEEAVNHIRHYGSRHSESIVTEDSAAARIFCRRVDAACVYVNAPTSFTDGAQFGLGAEIGISTQKLHARGPMGLEEITTYKWIIEGEGQVRP